MNGKEFFEGFLTKTLAANPGVIADAGIKSQAVSVDIEGHSGGQWTLAFDGSGHASLAAGENSSNCTIQMNEKTWEGLLSGSLNVPWAVMTRKIKIKGETSLAAKLGLAIKKVAGK